MDKKVGIIGCGNMANGIISGIIASNLGPADKIVVSDMLAENLVVAKEKYGICTTKSNCEVAKDSDIIFLAIKPYMYRDIIGQIKDVVTENKIIVSIAPGISLETLEGYFGKAVKVVRTMPNMPAQIGEGMTAVSFGNRCTDEDKLDIEKILCSFGKMEVVHEDLMSTVVAVSGSSPAYIFMVIEAMGDAAVKGGMNRDQAYKFAAQAVLGSAKMVLETGIHPAVLKDMICSPGGTTIDAVSSLEAEGLRSSIIKAMDICRIKAEKHK